MLKHTVLTMFWSTCYLAKIFFWPVILHTKKIQSTTLPLYTHCKHSHIQKNNRRTAISLVLRYVVKLLQYNKLTCHQITQSVTFYLQLIFITIQITSTQSMFTNRDVLQKYQQTSTRSCIPWRKKREHHGYNQQLHISAGTTKWPP